MEFRGLALISHKEYSLSQTLITGVYRSGTEYLTHMLNEHPQLSATMYRVNAIRFIGKRYDPLHNLINLNSALDVIKKRCDHFRFKFPKDQLKKKLMHSKCSVYDFYDQIMSHLYLNKKKRHWAEKNQLLWRQIPSFLKGMPNGKAIILIRDPRKVLLSFKYFTNSEFPAYLGAVYNCLDVMQWAIKLTKLHPDKIIILRFEDLLKFPKENIKKVWLKLDLDPELKLESSKPWLDVYGNKWKINSSFNKKNINKKFNINLLSEEVQLVEKVCKKEMQYFGYSLLNLNSSINNIINLITNNPSLKIMHKRWQEKGEGSQKFPKNPLDKSTWDKDKENN